MRESLTALAVALIGLLTAALVGPHLVDWDAHRDLVERELSRAAGMPVALAGHIDLVLLPTPLVHADGLSVGGGSPAAPRLTAAAVDAELSVTALLRGELQVVDATLLRPRLELVEGCDGSFGLSPPSGAAAERVAIEHLAVRDGALTVRMADGRRVGLSRLDFDGEASGLRGPFKAAGRAGAVPFRIAAGALAGGRLRLKLHLDGEGARPGLDLDGFAAPKAGVGIAFDGAGTASGRVALTDDPASVPWRLQGRVSADPHGAAATELDLRAGADDRALIASGEGTASFAGDSGRTTVALQLRGPGLDLDRLAVPPEGSNLAPPSGPALLAAFIAGRAAAPAILPGALDVTARFDTATVGGRTLSGLDLALGSGRGPETSLRVAASGPDGARVSLDGRLAPATAPPASHGPFGAAPAAGEPSFHGRMEAGSRDLRRSAAWLRPAAPALADLLAAVPGRAVSARGEVDLSSAALSARDVALQVDATSFSGGLSVTPASGARAARLSADLSTPALDLAALPDPALAAASPLDLDLRLSAEAVTVAAPGAGIEAPFVASRAAGHLLKTGDAVALDGLSLIVDGAAVEGSASRDRRGARAEAHVAAARFGPLAGTLARLLPAGAAAALGARAPALSPLDVTVRAEARVGPDGALAPTRLSASGTAGATRLEASLVPDGAGPADGTGPGILAARAEAADGVALLRQLGLKIPGPAPGPARIDVAGRGSVADGFTGRAEAALGPDRAVFEGRAGPAGASGRFNLTAPDAGPALAAADILPAGPALPADLGGAFRWTADGIALDDLSGRVAGASVQGDLTIAARPAEGSPALRGRLAFDRLPGSALAAAALGLPAGAETESAWSRRPFAPPAAALPTMEVALAAAEMPLDFPGMRVAARDVSLTLRAGGGAVAFADAAARVGGGRVAGGLTLRRAGADVSASGHASWTGLPVSLGALGGRGTGHLDAAGSGGNPAALVSALAGTGVVSLANAAVSGADPGAPARTLARIAARDAAAERGSGSSGATAPDPAAVDADLASELGRGALALGDVVDAPATLAGGVLRVGPIRASGTTSVPPTTPGGAAAGAPWTAETTATLDVASPSASSRTVLHGAPAGAAPVEVTISASGPIGGVPARAVDGAGLVGALQALAIARAQDRIDVLEQDIRERAAFERQRKAAEAAQQAERDRADAARLAAAEAARQAAAEARHQAEAARAAEARRRAEDDRLQAEVAAAARAEAARAEAEKRRFFDRALSSVPADGGDRPRQAGPGRESSDPAPPPSIIDER